MSCLPQQLRPFALFAASVLVSKGLSLISIPLIARHLPPSEYGHLELIASIVEIAGIVMTFGLADSLFRLASGEPEQEQLRVAAGLTGLAIILAIIAGTILQAAAWLLLPLTSLHHLVAPIAIGLAAATLTGLIGTPLAWLRLKNEPGLFLLFTAARSALQVAAMITTLSFNEGVTGILAGNAFVDLVIASLLVISQIRRAGFCVDRNLFSRAAAYGFPIVGGSLSMFVLGACDRWFLAASVDSSELGFYGLASKLSFIVPLALQPFGLWWNARRFAVLREPEGLALSSRMISIGMIFLGTGVAVTCIGAPIFIETLLPAAYRNALTYLPWLALTAALNEICSLVNVGVYAAVSGFGVLAINGVGGLVALSGYAALVPDFGVGGAIAATIAGQAARLLLFIFVGRSLAPIKYAWGLCFAIASIDYLLIQVTRASPGLAGRTMSLIMALAAFSYLAWRRIESMRAANSKKALA
jgi:O-antigen/teichoic acid export membrane protein